MLAYHFHAKFASTRRLARRKRDGGTTLERKISGIEKQSVVEEKSKQLPVGISGG